MKDSAKVIRKLVIGIACTLGSWSSAQACSYAFKPSAAYNYSGLNLTYVNTSGYVNPEATKPQLRSYLLKSEFEDIIDDSSSIFIAKVKRKPLNSIGGNDREYDRFIFNVEKTLKGNKYKKVEYTDSEGRIVPGLSKQEFNEELSRNYNQFLIEIEQQLNNHREFRFWDNPQFFKNEMFDEVLRGTSCGPNPTPILAENQLYLVIANGATFSERFIVEPISGKDDPFYQYVIDRVEKPFDRTGPKTTHKKFLKEMDFVKVVEIKSCSKEIIEKASADEWKPYLAPGPSFSPKRIFDRHIQYKIISDIHGDFSSDFQKELEENYPSLFEYFRSKKSKVDCKFGEQFLVYGLYPEEELSIFETYRTPIYRYARIKGGKVISDDIKTNINLVGNETFSVSELFEQ